MKTSLRFALMAVAISFVTIAAAGTPLPFLTHTPKPVAVAFEPTVPFFGPEQPAVASPRQPFRPD